MISFDFRLRIRVFEDVAVILFHNYRWPQSYSWRLQAHVQYNLSSPLRLDQKTQMLVELFVFLQQEGEHIADLSNFEKDDAVLRFLSFLLFEPISV